MGIIGATTGIVGSNVFRVLSVQSLWRDEAVATKNIRHAGSRFTNDALHAHNATDGQGASLQCDTPADSATLALIDDEGAHTAIYSLFEGNLVRDFDGTVSTIIDETVEDSLEFTLCDKVLTMNLLAQADGVNSKTLWRVPNR